MSESGQVAGAKVVEILGVDVTSLAPEAAAELTKRLLEREEVSEGEWVAVDPVRDLATEMAERHRPRKKRDVMAYVEQYLVQCGACDRDAWQIWREGDPAVVCDFWTRALALGLVEA